MYEREAIVQKLEDKLDHNNIIQEECKEFIKRVIEARHQRVLDQ